MNTKHIVFDLDWTLADTQIIHQEIESDFLKKFWIEILAEEIWKKFAWRTPNEWISEILKENNKIFTQEDLDNFVESKDKKVIQLLESWKIKLMDWTELLLNNLYNDWFKIWISSWACREFIDKFIEYFNFSWIIEASTSANEVENKKPHPDVFNESFKQLERKYWKNILKIVVWDWWSDVLWGNKAWAKTIWINDNSPKNNEILDFQVKSISEIYGIIKKDLLS